MNEGRGKPARQSARRWGELKLATLGCALGTVLANVGCQERDQSETGAGHFSGTNTLLMSLSSAVFSGSVTYSSMNESFASSFFSSRWLVIAS